MATYGYGRVSRMQQCTENQKLVLELQQKIKIDQWFELKTKGLGDVFGGGE